MTMSTCLPSTIAFAQQRRLALWSWAIHWLEAPHWVSRDLPVLLERFLALAGLFRQHAV